MNVFTMLICVMMSFSGVAMVAPCASLIPLNAQEKKMVQTSGKTHAQRAKEAPSKDEIEIPSYPGSQCTSYPGASR